MRFHIFLKYIYYDYGFNGKIESLDLT